ncbi:MAG: toll/interleukin-1 receptor domain-containing protein [Nitrospirae bacterium]|nr:toll/interleukin-1 receptor domain-containing protein [Nitrospirota bacterium]
MAFLTKAAMRVLGESIIRKSARTVLAEAIEFDPDKIYDVFLSHSSRDKTLVIGVKTRLEVEGLDIYVDWIDDATLDRTKVTPENAERLRKRMRRCRSLLYLATDNASHSKWMPWEVGYFDGLGQGKIGILPVLNDPGEPFVGTEYLGLYSVVEEWATKGGPIALFARQTDGNLINLKRLIQ